MQFEVEFRGKRLDNGQQVFGDLIRRKSGANVVFSIYANEEQTNEGIEYPIEAESVSVFTGLVDKNGTKIFESDKVEFYYKGEMVVCEVVWVRSLGMFCLKWKDGYINQYPLNPDKYTVIY